MIKDKLGKMRLYMDGGMGTLLQSLGLKPGELPEEWNISRADDIVNIHKSYYNAGSNIVCTNTFGANRLSYADRLEDIVCAAVHNAMRARESAETNGEKYIALDIGPLGKLLKPYGDFEFEKAVETFAETVKIGTKAGADIILIETMSDSYETKAAVLAAKENSDLPIFVSCAYGSDGKLMTGASPSAMTAMLEGLGADAIGVNCSLGPKQLMGVVSEILEYSSTPVFAKPNAGLPIESGNVTKFEVEPRDFALEMADMAALGVSILGGCCGTTPEYIRETVAMTKDTPVKPILKKDRTLVSSYTHCVQIGNRPVIIGERINPTGKKRFKQALTEKDTDYILGEGIRQQDEGADILDVNVGLPGIDEVETLENTVFELQSVINLPLQIDTSDPHAMERALRIYNGKAMINSVSGKQEVMDAVFPLVKKYGGVVVALTLDDNGIPKTADGRIDVARKILAEAAKYGIDKKDIVFDPLCMSVSADPSAAAQTLRAVEIIRRDMGINTVLGVSNISFGLPHREIVNSNFFALALERGLSAGIINPHSDSMIAAYRSYMLLNGYDENCVDYIAFASSLPQTTAVKAETSPQGGGTASDGDSPLMTAVIKGLGDRAEQCCNELIQSTQPLDIVNNHIVPALDTVGKGFENKTVYLPQLLMSAEAAKRAFGVVKNAMSSSGTSGGGKSKFVIATVKGDIHDIGKNIVKVLLENYGFRVIDLGKDVAPEIICDTVIKENAPMCGLSALMTTTVPAMEQTIALLRQKAPECKIVVGGAVLNRDYAKRIGADKYGSDAMETVRFAEEYENEVRHNGAK